MEHIEHPAIARLMATGYVNEHDMPVCPMCGAETDTFYTNSERDIIGCDECVHIVDAWEHKSEVT